MKNYIFIALSFMVVLFSSCEKDVVVTGLALDKTTLSISSGGTGTLVASIHPTSLIGTTSGKVIWTSSNADVATVSDGIVTGVSAGTAKIVASVGTYTASCDVTVSAAITSVTLNKTSLRLKVDSTQTLTATLLPTQTAEIAKNVSWVSTNPSVATVDQNGKVIGLTNGSTNVVVSIGTVTSVCSVTVYTTVPTSLMGSNYYLISLDNGAVDMLGSANIAGDFRANGVNNNFYVWNGLNEGTYSGTNFFGNTDKWWNFVVTGVGGWSGAAINVKAGTELNKLKAITDDVTGKYYLHFAIKSSTTNSYAFKMGYGDVATSSKAITFVLGTTTMESTNPYGNFTRNGQWQEIEIPMSYFKGKGLVYTTGMTETNLFVMLAGGTAGVKLEVDAVFIYKKP